jgi:hypothetical protein
MEVPYERRLFGTGREIRALLLEEDDIEECQAQSMPRELLGSSY